MPARESGTRGLDIEVVKGRTSLERKFGIWKAIIANARKRTKSAGLLNGCARVEVCDFRTN